MSLFLPDKNDLAVLVPRIQLHAGRSWWPLPNDETPEV